MLKNLHTQPLLLQGMYYGYDGQQRLIKQISCFFLHKIRQDKQKQQSFKSGITVLCIGEVLHAFFLNMVIATAIKFYLEIVTVAYYHFSFFGKNSLMAVLAGKITKYHVTVYFDKESRICKLKKM